MGLVIIDHWAQKSVSDRFVFFLGIMLLLAVGNTPFAFILGTSALPCHYGMKFTSQASPKKERISAARETVALSRLPSEKRDARCYAALCSLGFCSSPQMKCL